MYILVKNGLAFKALYNNENEDNYIYNTLCHLCSFSHTNPRIPCNIKYMFEHDKNITFECDLAAKILGYNKLNTYFKIINSDLDKDEINLFIISYIKSQIVENERSCILI